LEGEYENCIDADPLFTHPLNYNFTPSWYNYPIPDLTKSPCIDAGCPGLLPEPDFTCNDIGADFFFQQLDIPEALDPEEITSTTFKAVWTSAFGALGYHIDVALDEGFMNPVYKNVEILGDTTYLVEDLDPDTKYYYRLNSFNSTLTSEYSNTQTAITLLVLLDDSYMKEIGIYANQNHVCIDNVDTYGDIWIYDLMGRQLNSQEICPGSNRIEVQASDQIVIVKLSIQGKTYLQKLLIP
jgi:hypothetical protein